MRSNLAFKGSGGMVSIIDFDNKYAEDFRQLNLEWLDKYNLTESHDLQVLDDPQGTIINNGGSIFLASIDEKIAGSAALMKNNDDEFELAKMTVAPAYRGMGISKMLLQKCLTKAKELQAKRIILFSNHQLVTAIKLYEQSGFRHILVEGSPFETADIKMELILP